MQSAIELTRDLVRFNTINPPGNERACAEHLASLLEKAGFAVDLVPFGEARAQLIARIGGSADRLPLGFTGVCTKNLICSHPVRESANLAQ